jgi:hypothetical protein
MVNSFTLRPGQGENQHTTPAKPHWHYFILQISFTDAIKNLKPLTIK